MEDGVKTVVGSTLSTYEYMHMTKLNQPKDIGYVYFEVSEIIMFTLVLM